MRNLEPGEIVGQIMLARDHLEEWPSAKVEKRLTNIVMMGMGEPLYNYDNVKKALEIAMDGDGVAISKRRITLSTSGVVPMIEKCGAELGVALAISLHADGRRARHARAYQQEMAHQRIAGGLPRLPGGEECSSHYLRIRHARWCQRSGSGRARASAV